MTQKQQDEKYMARCLQLAALGRGHVSPNPMVGAVIVHQGKIIGEGYHRKCGEAHAEVNAIRAVGNESLLKESTIYVSLEPCSHWGKTPPCSKLIIEKGIRRVVVGVQDPFFEVSGRGIQMMREAGIEVEVGVLEHECLELNKAFFTVQQQKRPYVILKWAQSADGFIDRVREVGSDEKPAQISNPVNSLLVHKLRSESDAILVGTNTVLLDNPQLTVRKWDGKHPTRVFPDRTLRVPGDVALLDGSVATWIFTEKEAASDFNKNYITIPFDSSFPYNMLQEMARREVQTLLVEGGARMLSLFLSSGYWDEARVEIGSVILEKGVAAPVIENKACSWQTFGDSVVLSYSNKR
ncbi:MAG: bifunctional diaminohydroxyphosphoribosylaminopyrimidine deaminase/5-amino-6-(5-phosphoribosylamino)uracil reductase RibD [Bacteroidales bacterium]